MNLDVYALQLVVVRGEEESVAMELNHFRPPSFISSGGTDI